MRIVDYSVKHVRTDTKKNFLPSWDSYNVCSGMLYNEQNRHRTVLLSGNIECHTDNRKEDWCMKDTVQLDVLRTVFSLRDLENFKALFV